MPGWAPPDSLSELIRDNIGLRITCVCGHTAEPPVMQLRRDLWMLGGGGREKLDELHRYLRCGQCGAKDMTIEQSKP